MQRQTRIIAEIANRECQRISISVIRRLQKLNGRSLLYSEDSGLINTWDEICVEVQSEETYYRRLYLPTIEDFVDTEIDKLASSLQQAIWLQTENGSAWEPEDGDPVNVPQDIADYVIQEYVLNKAEEWSNRRIDRYLTEYA